MAGDTGNGSSMWFIAGAFQLWLGIYALDPTQDTLQWMLSAGGVGSLFLSVYFFFKQFRNTSNLFSDLATEYTKAERTATFKDDQGNTQEVSDPSTTKWFKYALGFWFMILTLGTVF